MLRWTPEALERAEEAIAEMHSNTRVQFFGDALMAAVFGAMVGWIFCAAWLATTIAVRLVRMATIPWAVRNGASRERLAAMNLAFICALYLVVGSLGVAAGLRSGSWAMVAAIQVQTAMLLYASHAAKKSLHAYLAFVGPMSVYMLAIWGVAFWQGAPPAALACLGLNAVTTTIMSVNVWRSAANAAIMEADARRTAEAATAAKSSFVAMVSHDLRTPISGILAGAEEIRKTSPDSVVRGNAALIVDSGKMMRHLLDDLLDLSKIEAGRMSVEHIDFDLRQLMRDTALFWAPEARKHDLRFRLAGSRMLPRWVRGDPTRLRQILNNLLSNALKFTSAGSITVNMSAETQAGEYALRLEVIDTGQGMSADEIGRLFQAFDQLHASTARTHGGTGLGLNISRQLAQLMHGDLTAESVEGRGSMFRLTLALAPGTPVVVDAVQPDLETLTPAGVSVLVVDDHAVNRQAFALILRSVCDDVVCVVDGEEALEALSLRRFDVVLMDLNMPRLGGLEATRRLRAAAGPNRTTPVIALTASVSPRDVDVCLAAGMNSFVLKPVEAGELIRAVAHVLSPEPHQALAASA